MQATIMNFDKKEDEKMDVSPRVLNNGNTVSSPNLDESFDEKTYCKQTIKVSKVN